jgi:leader peptidase (prepilin peptidase)/N-methyltransferase
VTASELPAWLVRALAFVLGALWGSFFNVAIYRWPRDMSVVSPRSHCTHCGTPVAASNNVPIFGWLFLRGKTACCGKPLSARYMFVELMAAVLAVAIAERYLVAAAAGTQLTDAAIVAALYFAFAGGLIIASFVDLEWFEIPDEVSIGGAALGLASVSMRGPGAPDVLDCAIGAGAGYLLVQVVLVWSWERLTGRVGMAEGDSRLLMFVGAFLGWQGALFALVAGALQGILASGVMLAAGKKIRPAAAKDVPADDDHRDPPPAPLEMKDGTKVELLEGGAKLRVSDGHGRLMWEHELEREEDPSFLRRAIPFGPFIALAALEFLFFGDRLTELYLSLFE